MLTGTVAAVAYMFSHFVSAEDLDAAEEKFQEQVVLLSTDIWYGQFYDRLDDYDEADAEGNEELAKEYMRQMERMKAKICEEDPEWERCDDEL